MKESRIVFTPQMARYLLHKGFVIVDVKPDRKKERDTIFVFKNESGLQKAISEFKQI